LVVLQPSNNSSRQYRLGHRHRKDSHCVDEWQCSGAVSASNQRLLQTERPMAHGASSRQSNSSIA